MSDVSTKPESKPNSKYAVKKQRAIEAAAKVFADKGFHGATTQDIADELGIKQGSLYYYFKSKEQALQEVCEFGLQNYVDEMQKICMQSREVNETLFNIIGAHLSNYRNEHSAMKVHNDQRLYLPKDRRARIKKLGTEYRALLEQVISEGVDDGHFRANLNPHFVAYSIIGLCNTWGANLLRDEALGLTETITQCADLILSGARKEIKTA